MNTNIDHVDKITKKIVFGYARKLKNENGNKIYFTIPTVIMNIILFYYFDGYKFDEKYFRVKNIILTNHGKTIHTSYASWNTCILNDKISNKKCDKFTLHLRWNEITSYCYIGYVYKTEAHILATMKLNGLGLGEGDHRGYSVGIFVQGTDFMLYDQDNKNKKLNYRPSQVFKNGDTFRLCFDFKNDSWTIYHNDCYAVQLSMNGYKTIIPGISVFCMDEEIEILKWSFS